ncbi:STAS domain-containing protein [Salirhabdus sp. Marseille-P4669]|uniref:STAS domain-containing protein n=1 Tax=Salirhabdus sp. Marseille-P4669 TaxID=2042310 RepID=UPI000C7A2087|nr:STAS domain-containing protein [Salirhabdus sp. Marseille-P4669]
MDKVLQQIVLENRTEITEQWLSLNNDLENIRRVADVTNQLLDTTNKEFLDVIFGSVEKKGKTAELANFSERLIKLGWPLNYITNGLQSFRRITINFILEKSEETSREYFSGVLESVDRWIDPVINYLVSEYSGSWEHTVALQKIALQELSAPLIPVIDGITVMPLIGTIDTERAKLIMENLLDGTMKHNSEVVLIDITGVPVVDTMVAHHIIQAAEAVRLVGATCILVGIRPEIAQTIVNLGIDLSRFPTKSSLRKGFNAALQLTGRTISTIKNEEKEIEQIIDSLSKG